MNSLDVGSMGNLMLPMYPICFTVRTSRSIASRGLETGGQYLHQQYRFTSLPCQVHRLAHVIVASFPDIQG
jgi:hypothetical protein